MNLSQTSIIITGCGRNVSPFVPGLKRTIMKYVNIFNKCECFFVESDSTDETHNRLLTINEHVKTTVVALGNLENTIQSREERLAHCRNIYLDYVSQNCSHYDYMLVLDLDEVCLGPVSHDSIKSNFKHSDWDMMCANVRGFYYDYHALRSPESKLFDIRPTRLDPRGDIIRVASAFGGAAFIRVSSIGKSRHDTSCGSTCEWVSFCRSMSNIYINPAYIVQQIESVHIKKHIND